MTLYDQFGKEILTNKPILREVASQTVRDRYSSYPSQGLTAERLAAILKEADQGYILRQAELCEEMEEKDTHLGSVLQTRRRMHSTRAIELHFWIATIGIVLYIAAMWIAGVMQGLMWRAVNPDGTLVYSFVESVKATYPFYVIRLAGGLLYLAGMLIMAWNGYLLT